MKYEIIYKIKGKAFYLSNSCKQELSKQRNINNYNNLQRLTCTFYFYFYFFFNFLLSQHMFIRDISHKIILYSHIGKNR